MHNGQVLRAERQNIAGLHGYLGVCVVDEGTWTWFNTKRGESARGGFYTAEARRARSTVPCRV